MALLAGFAGLTATSPAEAAVETYNPFDVTVPDGSDAGFTFLATGNVQVGNGELEGSAAAFGTIEDIKGGAFPLLHQVAGVGDYEVPTVDGDPTRALAGQFVGPGNFDHTNAGAPEGSPEDRAIAKFADTTNLTGEQRADFTRLVNSDSTGGETGVWDLEKLPWNPDTWQETVQTERSSVADYFPNIDQQVDRANACLASMYDDTAGELGNELTVAGDQNAVTLSGFSDSMPNWVNYEDIANRTVSLDPSDWAPTAEAPLVIKVNDPTDTIGPINIQGWSAGADQQQTYARYILLDASESTAAPLTIDGLELGAVWAPGVDLEFTGSRTTNGQWFADDVTTSGGGEIHHHTFMGQLLCETASASFQIHKDITGDAADQVPDDTEFTVDYEVTDGPDAGQTGELTLLADGTVVDGPQLQSGDTVEFSEADLPDVDGVAWGEPRISPNPITLDDSGEPVDVTVTNTANPTPTGGFAVQKAIDGTGADLVDPSTEFSVNWEVTDGPDTGESGTMTVPADGTIVDGPQNLADGSVVEFSEPDAPQVDGTTYEGAAIDPQTVTIDSSAPETPIITVTNTYDLAPATFQIHKEITGDAADQVPDDTEFTVRWRVVSGPDQGQNGTLTVTADGTVVDGPQLTHGDRVVLSEPDLPTIDGVRWGIPRISPRILTLDAESEPINITVTNNANEIPAGGFAVQKAIDGTGSDLVDPSTEFSVNWEVTDGPDTGESGTLTVPADGTIVDGPQNLADGDVVEFSEPDAPEVDGTTYEGATIDPQTVTIDSSAPETPIITVTNTYDLAPATFQIHKEITGDAADQVPDDTEFTVDYEVTDGPDAGQTGELTLLADGTVVDGPELSHGDSVEFSEPDLPDVDGVAWGEPRIDPDAITLDAESQTVNVAVTNTANESPTGGFAVQKAIDGTGSDLVDPSTEFTVNWEVTDGPDTGESGTMTVPADGTIVDGPQNLADGDVVEFSEPAAPEVDGTTYEGAAIDPQTVTIDSSAPEIPIITVTNTYDLAPATFQIHKEITGDAADQVPDDTEFAVNWRVTSGPDQGQHGTLTLLADGSVVAGPEGLQNGDVVRFTEDDPPEVDGVEWGKRSIDPASLTLSSDAEVVNVTVTNTADTDESDLPDTGASGGVLATLVLAMLSLVAGLGLIVRSRLGRRS